MDHDSHESVPVQKVMDRWLETLEARTGRDLSAVGGILDEPTEADRQLEVWRETGSAVEVARDVAKRTRASVEEPLRGVRGEG